LHKPSSSLPGSEGTALTTVSVILPTCNERGNIGPLIAAALQSCYQWTTDVLVVDDDSPDGTWQVVKGLAEQDGRVRLLRRIGERGLTSAIRSGISATEGDVTVWMDCDFSMPPEHIPLMVAAIADDACDVAVGSRYVPGGRDVGHGLTAQLFSRTINLFAGLLLGFGVRDYTSGFIAARRAVLDGIDLRGDYGEYCIDFLVRACTCGYRLLELGYVCETRRTGESKTGANPLDYLRRGWKYVAAVLRLVVARK
jgi:dolichol-phosphate mannosyltransferase